MAIWKTEWGWRAEVMHKGKRHRCQGFFRTKPEAKQWVKETKVQLKENHSNHTSQDKVLNLWSLLQIYLQSSELNFSRKTFKEKKSCYERFYSYTGDIEVTDVQPLMLLAFRNKRAEKCSNNAANKDLKNLKAFFSWVCRMHGILWNPAAPIDTLPHSKKTRRLIPIKDLLRVLLAAQGHDRVLMGAYWHTGARKSEVLRWTWDDDINFEQRWVRLGTRKSRSREMVYEKLWINDDLYKLLKWQWDHRHPASPYVFCHMNPKSKYYGEPYGERRKTLKRLCELAEVEPFGYHDIRHTVAKYLNDIHKVGLKKVQQVLRHRRQSTTEIYVDGNYGDTRDTLKLLEMGTLEKAS